MSNQTHERKPRWFLWIPLALAAAAAVSAIAARWWYKQRAAQAPRKRVPAPPVIPPSLRGLTEEEAQARRQEGQDNAIPFRPARDRKQILKENIFTIFNLSLVGLSFSQLLLGLPLDALISLGMIALNAALNIGQEMFARIRLKEIEEASRLQATVIREGKVRSIDPNEIVLGDALVVGPGDHLLVDGELVGEGQIVVDESMLTGKPGRLSKRGGDKVYAGSFCVSGRAACEAEKVGTERLYITQLAATEAGKEERTALERIIDRVLKTFLVVVAIFTVIILVRYFNLTVPVDVDQFASAIQVIYSIAPASLFFMIFLTYAGGSADLGRLGALVNRTRSVESLAQATTLCFAEAGVLTGTNVEMEPIESLPDQEHLSASRIDQILGDYVRSTSVSSPVMRTMAANFEGSRRMVVEEAPFLTAFGWSAISFDDDDLRGVYVLGGPLVLEENLVGEDAEEAETEAEASESPVRAFRKRLPSLGRFFGRSQEEQETEDETAGPPEEKAAVKGETNPVEAEEAETEQPPAVSDSHEMEDTPPVEDGEPKQNFFQRFRARVRRALPSSKEETEQEAIAEEPQLEENILLFAYLPQVVPLHGPDGSPQLPEELIPLCRLRYSEQIRPEAIETIQSFSETGVSIKIFSSSSPDHTATILRQAGLGTDEVPLGILSGPELTEMDAGQLGEAVQANTIFGHVAPEQTALVVQTLREQGQAVAVIGDAVNDVPSLRQANLSIAGHTGSQAALSVADIVLTQDSPKVLLGILNKGQRIVNGLMDVLRLYVTQMLYLTLLIAATMVFFGGFPYASKQGSIIAIVTLSLPAIALSLWAAAGQLPTKDLRRLLTHFVIPAALTIGAAGMLVYALFLERTGDKEYTQLVLTYALVAMGLLLVLFLRPPTRLWGGGSTKPGGRRFTIVVVVLLIAFLLVSMIPLAYELFLLEPLRQPLDYAVVGAIVLGWAVTLRLIWWVMPLATRVERATRGVAGRVRPNRRS